MCKWSIAKLHIDRVHNIYCIQSCITLNQFRELVFFEILRGQHISIDDLILCLNYSCQHVPIKISYSIQEYTLSNYNINIYELYFEPTTSDAGSYVFILINCLYAL